MADRHPVLDRDARLRRFFQVLTDMNEQGPAAIAQIGGALQKALDVTQADFTLAPPPPQENHMPTILSRTAVALTPTLADPSVRRPVVRVRAHQARYTEPRGRVLFWTVVPIDANGHEIGTAHYYDSWRQAIDAANSIAGGGEHHAA